MEKRSYKKELLDGEDIPFADIKQNMQELNTINHYLGGHAVSLAGIKALFGKPFSKKSLTICEIGCGGGDNLYAIDKWCNKNNIVAGFTGIDIKGSCLEYASLQYPLLAATWINSDYAAADLSADKPDIIFSSLFCHHFNETELIEMILWMKQNCKRGFFINDLHRHPVAYRLIKLITGIFSNSYLVKNDAPLSVARGFKKTEWEAIFRHADLSNYSIKWKWAFRHLIVWKNEP